jgi:hypothetical protein
MRFQRSAGMRRPGLFLSSLLLTIVLLPPAIAAAQDRQSVPAAPTAQDTRRFDAALSGFAQISAATNGNSIREDTSESIGGLASFRQPYKPWLGYELNYGYTRYSEFYAKGVTTVRNHVHEFTAAYLLQTPTGYYGFKPFLTFGTGIIVFAPTSAGGHGRSSQTLPVFVYSLGFNHLVLSDHIGIRVQYRAVKYKTPSFNEVQLDSERLRTTMEPAIGAYFRF